MTSQGIEYSKLSPGYELAPASFQLDKKTVASYLQAVEDSNPIYLEKVKVPPLAIAALAMAAMSAELVLPPGTIHVSQELEFSRAVYSGETLTSYARVNRRVTRGKLHLLTIGINVLDQNKAAVITGETSFILPI